MDKRKLEILKDEIINFINEHNFGENISIIERFEIMNNVNRFLDSDNYEENIQILNEHLHK